MRTTVTLDPDVELLIKRRMNERKLSFKQAVNEAIRAGAGASRAKPIDFPTYDLGEPLVDLTKALQLAGELEDEVLLRRMSEGR